MLRKTPFAVGLLLFVAAAVPLPARQGPTASTAATHANLFGEMRWRNIGPMRAGRTKALAGVPSQPFTFYMGMVNGGVWKTTNAGRTWVPIFDDQPTGSIGSIAVAPSDPNVIYVGSGEGLQRPDLAIGDGMYKSTDAGRTWTHLGLRDTQQIARVEVDPRNPNRLFVAALGHPYGPNEERGIFRSTDGGKTFGPGVTVNTVTPATPDGALVIGPGQFIRTIEFPTLALHAGKLYLGWNDGRTGQSHIRVDVSSDGGQHWTDHQATFSTSDEIQPALTGDASGLHLAYYRRNADNTLDVVVADSTDGVHFTPSRVTNTSFPGVFTVPQFDPIIAFGYMGDYIAQVSASGHQYFAWGDNRRTLVDFTFPRGRHDPDVFFAKR
jgi:hypothetical protein